MVHCYYIDDSINQFAIGYMINPSPHLKKGIPITSWKMLKCYISWKDNGNNYIFSEKEEYMCYGTNNFFDNNGVKPKKCIGC